MPIVIDASVICAFANSVDVHHRKAASILGEVVAGKYGRGLLTDYLFDEAVTVALRKAGRERALELGHYLLHSELSVAKIDGGTFHRAWQVFKRKDGFSFTDCTTIAFMEALRIRHLATFDKSFQKVEGIQVIDG